MKIGHLVLIAIHCLSCIPAATLTRGKAAECVPVPPNIFAWWAGEENALDYIVTHDGTLTNGATFADGLVGKGFLLDGVDDYVEVLDSPTLTLSSEFTVEAWVLAHDLGDGTVASRYDTSSHLASWVFRIVDEGTPGRLRLGAFQGGTTSGLVIDTASPVIVPDTFVHVAGSIDLAAKILKIYVDGVEVPVAIAETNSASSFFPTSTPVRIGTFINSSGSRIAYFAGIIDELSLYSRALSSDEIAAIHAAGSAGKCRVPPSADLLPNWDATPITTCIPLSLGLNAQVHPGTHLLNRVEYFDGDTLIGESTRHTNAWRTMSTPLDYGHHSITAQAVDRFGLRGASQNSTFTLKQPDLLSMHINQAEHGEVVCCMGTELNHTYAFEDTSSLKDPPDWTPLMTNRATSTILRLTNQTTVSELHFRGVELP